MNETDATQGESSKTIRLPEGALASGVKLGGGDIARQFISASARRRRLLTANPLDSSQPRQQRGPVYRLEQPLVRGASAIMGTTSLIDRCTRQSAGSLSSFFEPPAEYSY
jgi:hypothetical protein